MLFIQFNQILVGFCFTLLFASSNTRENPRHSYYQNTFPQHFQYQIPQQTWSRGDIPKLPQSEAVISQNDTILRKAVHDPQDELKRENYLFSTSLERPFSAEDIKIATEAGIEDFGEVADEKKSNPKYKNGNTLPPSSMPSGSQLPPPPPVIPVLPVFYLVDESDPYYNHHYYNQTQDEEETTTTTTTTLAPFQISDVKVPVPFLRIEYMICYTFMGLMYGLGFFVLFQSIIVPAAKIAVVLSYIFMLKHGIVEPVTLEQALEQLPPT